MADIDPDQLASTIASAIKQSLGERAGPSGSVQDVLANLQKFGAASKQQSTFVSIGNKLLGEKNSAVIQEIRQIKQHTDYIKQHGNEEEKRQAKQRSNQLLANASYQLLSNSVGSLAGTMVNTAKNMAGVGASFITGLQNNASDLSMLGGVTKSSIGIIGSAIPFVGESLTKLGTFVVDVLIAEFEKTTKAFTTANQAGALFADGMTGLRNAAADANLTIEQFASVLGRHSTDLARLGMGVTEGARRVGGALTAGGDQMRKTLLTLGYSFEEQAGLVAETMADMRASGGPLRASNKQVAEQTQKYAENLRVISAITGQDAKKKMEAVRQQASQLAFQQKLAGMEESQRAAVIRAMGNMSDIERNNFMDMVNFGAVINKEGAVAQAMMPALNSSVNGYVDALRRGQLDEFEVRRLSAQNAEAGKQQLLGLTAIAQAGAAGVGGIIGQVSVAFSKELEYRNRYTAEGIRASERALEEQKRTADPLTFGMITLAEVIQKLRVAFQDNLTDILVSVASQLVESLPTIVESLKEFSLMINEIVKKGPKQLENKVSQVGGMVGAGAGALVGAKLGTSLGATIGAAAGGFGAIPGAAIGGVLGTLAGGALGYFGGSTLGEGLFGGGKAVGGPVDAGRTYLVGERGPELIMPRSSAEVVSNAQLPGMMSGTGLGDLKALVQEQVMIGRRQLEQSEEMAVYMNDIRTIQQQLLNATV